MTMGMVECWLGCGLQRNIRRNNFSVDFVSGSEWKTTKHRKLLNLPRLRLSPPDSGSGGTDQAAGSASRLAIGDGIESLWYEL